MNRSRPVPYPVALAGSVDQGAWLAAVVPGATGRVLRITRHDLSEGTACPSRVVWEAPSLHGLALTAAGGRLAIACPDHVRVVGPDEGEVVLPLVGVSSTCLAADGALWLLRGTDLLHVAADEPGLARPLAARVLAVARHAASDTLAWVQREPDHALVLVLETPAGRERVPVGAAMPAAAGWRIDLCLDACVAALMLRPVLNDGRRVRTVRRFDRRRGTWLAPVEMAPLAHLGLRDAGLQGGRHGDVFALVEHGDVLRVGRLGLVDADRAAAVPRTAWEPLTPPELEVQEFRVRPESDVLAYTHVAIDADRGAEGERALSIVRGLGAAAPRRTTHAGVAAAFAVAGDAVHFVERDAHALRLRVDTGRAGRADEAPDLPIVLAEWPLAADPRVPVRRLSSTGAWGGDGAPARGRPVLAVFPGLHKPATPCLQGLYLQEFLVQVARGLADHGLDADVCLLQLPGAAGRGRAFREAVGPQDIAGLARLTREAIDRLAEAAAAPVGLLSASLGAMGLLRALAQPGTPVACALLAPVFDPAVVGWPEAGAPASSAATDDACAGARSRYLLLHGTRDEVAPWAASERFAAGGAPGERRLVPLAGEGHIPSSWQSWTTVADEVATFFAQALAGAPAAAPPRTAPLPDDTPRAACAAPTPSPCHP